MEWTAGAEPPPAAVVTGRLVDGTPLFSGYGKATPAGLPLAGTALPGACATAPHYAANGGHAQATEMTPNCHVLCAQRYAQTAAFVQPIHEDPRTRAQWGWQIEARRHNQPNAVIAAGILWQNGRPGDGGVTNPDGSGGGWDDGGWVGGDGQPTDAAVFSADASGQINTENFGAGGVLDAGGGWGDAENGGNGGGGGGYGGGGDGGGGGGGDGGGGGGGDGGGGGGGDGGGGGGGDGGGGGGGGGGE